MKKSLEAIKNVLKPNSSSVSGIDRVLQAEEKLSQSAAELERAGNRMDHLALEVEEKQTEQARRVYEGSKVEYGRLSEEHERLRRALTVVKKQERQAAEELRLKKIKESFADLEASFSPLIDLADDIERNLTVACKGFHSLAKQSSEVFQKYQALAENRELGLDQVTPFDTGLGLPKLQGAFQLTLTKNGLPWAKSWYDSIDKIPRIRDGIVNAKGFMLKGKVE